MKHLQVITIFNGKGGVGKTTVAKELSMMFRGTGKRVLGIDLDGQRNFSKHFLRDAIDDVDKGGEVLFDKNASFRSVADALYESAYENVDLIPATEDLVLNTPMVTQAVGGQGRLKKTLQSVDAGMDYDICIIDVPPNSGNIYVLNALAASDYVIVPTELAQNSFDGLLDTFNRVEEVVEALNGSLQILGIVVNKYSKANTRANGTILQQMEAAGLDTYLFNTKIRLATVVVQAENSRASVVESLPGSSVAYDYKMFFQEVLERIERATNK